MGHVLETLGGTWELLRLLVRHGPRLRGRYWRWRYETAFGSDPARLPPRRERMRMVMAYGRWVWRMKRG